MKELIYYSPLTDGIAVVLANDDYEIRFLKAFEYIYIGEL